MIGFSLIALLTFVAIGVHRHAGIIGSIGGEVLGCLLVIDLQGSHDLWCVGLYAPINAHDHSAFFENLYT